MFLHGEYKVVSYGRFLPGEAVVVILNNDYEPHELNLHVRRLGVQDGAVMKACITTTESGYQMDETEYVVANNKLKITVGPISAVVQSLLYKLKMIYNLSPCFENGTGIFYTHSCIKRNFS